MRGAGGARLGRPLHLIAESDLNDPRMVTPRDAGGLGHRRAVGDDFHHALHALLTGEQRGYYADFAGPWAAGQGLPRRLRLRRPALAQPRPPARRRPPGRRPAGGSSSTPRTTTRSGTACAATGCRLRRRGPRAAGGGAGAALAVRADAVHGRGVRRAARRSRTSSSHTDPELVEAVRRGRARGVRGLRLARAIRPTRRAVETFARSRLDWEPRDHEAHAGGAARAAPRAPARCAASAPPCGGCDHRPGGDRRGRPGVLGCAADEDGDSALVCLHTARRRRRLALAARRPVDAALDSAASASAARGAAVGGSPR